MPPHEHVFEFHVSRKVRADHDFDDAIFAFNGNVIFANFRAAREFAQKINSKLDLINHPEKAVRASELYAMGLIDEILHAILEHYRTELNPYAMRDALAYLEATIGSDEIAHLLKEFSDQFPPMSVYKGQLSVDEYLGSTTNNYDHRQVALEELVFLWLTNNNPAIKGYKNLFDDRNLVGKTVYDRVIPLLIKFFQTQPKLEGQTVINVLLEPSHRSPNSLAGQLEFLVQRWRTVIGSRFSLRILGSLDFIREEAKIVFGTGGGSGEAISVYEFASQIYEPERFSPDRDWMPSLVLIAKNTYVWLDQLSKQYQQNIYRLDQVPDEELDRMAKLGFTGLWLIGLWERSNASQKIKQLCGNPEAVASAYSLFDYQIAQDLGGDEAYDNLRNRAWTRKIRLAADMVPNHVGIYSKWVIEHPNWFISLPYSPFPSYSFNGPDLSEDNRVGIFIEDHYYSKNDAAVVFKRVDRWTGNEQYIYHGNDGTSMPWNDTAQLDYLLPEVREAVIQTILHVARKFSVIRFDAAMTLAKKHFQRLWFPEPGSGGDIPTRSEHGLTRDQFNAAMPEEFWREVVDRVAMEVPDTLLLAEAFWLMEGYFVRTLGMHRVYNSAFMNMLRDEKNAEYRLVIKNTLEFDPEILKRYVNFMNNPDERTAVDQFGKGDKYFGVATLMSTMPGLPMFGHGQVEGFTEKYGMEYRKAYWDEQIDQGLVDRHRQEISPLLHRRYQFAEVNNFYLYDFFMANGNVNEDVFAYSNNAYGQRSLIVYHNRFNDTHGWINTSVAYAVKTGTDEEKTLHQTTLVEGLGIFPQADKFVIFRDQRTNLEYLVNSLDLADRGLHLDLGAYEYRVFLDFREVIDNKWQHYSQLAGSLGGKGTDNIEEALRELFLQEIHIPYRELVNAGQFNWIIQNVRGPVDGTHVESAQQEVVTEIEEKLADLIQAVKIYTAGEGDVIPLVKSITIEIQNAMMYYGDHESDISDSPAAVNQAIKFIQAGIKQYGSLAWGVLFGWSFTRQLGLVFPAGLPHSNEAAIKITYDWLDEWLLKKMLRNAFREMGMDDNQTWRATSLLALLVKYQDWYESGNSQKARTSSLLTTMFADDELRMFLAINTYQDIVWFNKDAFKLLVWGLVATSFLPQIPGHDAPVGALDYKLCTQIWRDITKIRRAEAKSDYQVQRLLREIGQ
jgi:glycosidase